MDSTDNKENPSRFDQLKDHSLKAAGYAYLVGDASLFASGAIAGRYKEASTGLLWGIGGLVCAKYGNPDADKQLKLMSHHLGSYLKKQGIAIPDSPQTQELARDGGIIEKVEAFLYRNPSEVLNGVYLLGSAQLMRSGMQHGKMWDTASGALIAAGALGGLLIHEKKHDEDAPTPEGFVDRCKQWIQEKPLRVPGIFYALNNVTLTMSALGEMKANPAQKSYLFKFLTAGSYIFGNTMLALSSKENKADEAQSRESLEKLELSAAHVIAAQPEPLRQALLYQVASYLAGQPEVKSSFDELAHDLSARLDTLTRKPGITVPAGSDNWQQRIHQPTETPSLSI